MTEALHDVTFRILSMSTPSSKSARFRCVTGMLSFWP